MHISIDYNKCLMLKCLECLDICPMNVFDISGNKLFIKSDANCVGCLACVDICPYNLITYHND